MSDDVRTLHVIDRDGNRHSVEGLDGWRVMEIIRDQGLSIKAECGGACACATCHVFIPAEWQAITGTITDDERDMLEFGVDVDDRSRLGCQIRITAEMDGMTVLTPRSQR